jgi:hypothetical protein
MVLQKVLVKTVTQQGNSHVITISKDERKHYRIKKGSTIMIAILEVKKADDDPARTPTK